MEEGGDRSGRARESNLEKTLMRSCSMARTARRPHYCNIPRTVLALCSPHDERAEDITRGIYSSPPFLDTPFLPVFHHRYLVSHSICTYV